MARIWDGATGWLTATGSQTDAFITQPLTVSCWIKPNTVGETAGRIFDKRQNEAGDAATSPAVIFYLTGTNQIGFINTDSGGANKAQQLSANNSVSMGAWQHVLVTYSDAGDRKGHIYVNGTEVSYTGGTDVAATGTLTDPTGAINLGQLVSTSGGGEIRTFDGSIAEFAHWQAILTADQIAALAAGYSPILVAPSTLKGYVPLDGRNGSGGAEFDWVSGDSYVNTGSAGTVTVGDHPRIIYPRRRSIILPPTLNSYTLTADAGSFTLTGVDAGLTAARTIAADAGAFTLTGVDADLIYTQAGAYTLNADAGAFTLTGNDVEFRYFNLTAETGAFSLDGINVGLIYSGAPPEAAAEQPAGRSSRKPSKRKRKPVVVTIDGQDFVVTSEAEAQQLVDAAAEIAAQKAEEQAAAIIAKRERKARKADLNTGPLRLDEPQITVRALDDGRVDATWLQDVADRMQAVHDAYAAVAQKYETALLLKHQQQIDEEDDLLTILLAID